MAIGKILHQAGVRLGAFLGVPEIGEDIRLRMLLAALHFYSFVTFNIWYGHPGHSTLGVQTFNFAPAWPLEHLGPILRLDPFWTNAVIGGCALLSVLGFFLAFTGEVFRSQLLLALIFPVHLFYYLSDLRLMHNYNHIHLILTFFFLLARPKLFFFRLALACCYLNAAMVKMTPSWLFGEAFRSVPDKLPFWLKADWAVTLACVSLMVWESIGPLFWFSRRRSLRLASVCLFVLFHLYSAVMVGYRYPTLMLTVLIPAFLNFERPVHEGYRFSKGHGAAWLCVALLLLGGAWAFLIPGDVRFTGEGRYFGLFMFEANRAIHLEVRILKGRNLHVLNVERPNRTAGLEDYESILQNSWGRVHGALYVDGQLTRQYGRYEIVRDMGVVIWNPDFFAFSNSTHFGDPYLYYFYAKRVCRRYNPDRLSLRLETQLDLDSQWHKVLDLEDFCGLDPSYRPFRHNDWIQSPIQTLPAFR